MGRPRTVFACTECGAQQPRWLGRCPECASWSSLVEERVGADAAAAPDLLRADPAAAAAKPRRLHEVDAAAVPRLATGIDELDHVLGGGLVIYAFAAKTFRRSFDSILAGVTIGLIIPAGWYVTGVVGFDDFDPVRLESYTFIAPAGESLMYLMTFTGSTIDFGVAAVGGVILGSFLYAITTGRFRLETFTDRADMLRHIYGGIAMGFGGVLALGCTIGQGITGMSTLALGSLLTLVSIIAGSVVTMRIQYRNL